MRWLLNGPALATLATSPVAQQFFAGSRPFVLQRKGDAVKLPESWHAIPIRSFASYAELKSAVAAGSLGPGVGGVLYDSEVWEFTPDNEQRDPATYMRLAAEAVHAKRLLFLTSPAVNLTKVLAPGPEKRYDAYLRLNIAAAAARYADVYDIQAQGSEVGVPRYSSFVQAAAQQARAANPKIIVLAGISTNPNGQHVTSDQIVRAITATRNSVDGYWFNIPQQSKYCPGCNDFRPDLAIEVLQSLAR